MSATGSGESRLAHAAVATQVQVCRCRVTV
jgi:hypothetical protein